MRRRTLVIVAAALVVAPAALEAQTPRRQAPIEIRGQVPTPQVVTVRPREVPAYSRQVLVPAYYDHDFWPSILPGYQIVPARMVSGRMAGDTATAPGATAPAPGDTTRRVPPASPRATPPAGGSGSTPAGAARPTGTAPALPRR